MTSKWCKLGLLYCPSGKRHPKLISHAANPLPIHLAGNIFRIFYSGRDANNRSSVGVVDIDIVTRKIIKDYENPFFEHGPKGSFFADGVSIGNCYDVNGARYMLFMGWQIPEDQHWRGEIGRLNVKPDLTLELENVTPFLALDSIDPVSLSYPWVQTEPSGEFKMWYGSTITWDAGNNEMLHVIKYAVSKDGHQWERKGLSVPYKPGVAQAFSRPTVITNQKGLYEMWFSYRSGIGETYRIGYATSTDCQTWDLKLEASGITCSDQGWDSEMIEYPFVFDHAENRYMLYNGNGYGKTGFGIAILDKD